MVIERPCSADELPFADRASVYERHIQNPNPEKPSLRQLIKLHVTDRSGDGPLWFGRGHFETHHPLNSGLDRLKLRPSGRAWYGIFKWNLPHGDIVEEREA